MRNPVQTWISIQLKTIKENAKSRVAGTYK